LNADCARWISLFEFVGCGEVVKVKGERGRERERKKRLCTV
jgi:hypothetical protein